LFPIQANRLHFLQLPLSEPNVLNATVLKPLLHAQFLVFFK
jgi:hypothetical protein